jgi:acetyl esterase/lipase
VLPSPLALLDAIVPKDRTSRRLARGLAFGPHPRHRLDLYGPTAKGPHPVLLFAYGGGWDSGRREEYSFAGRAFAAMGFLTAVADYRIWPEVQFPAFVEDAAAAANWLIAHAAGHGGDPTRFVLAGHSAGAYNAVTLALAPARFGAPDLAPRLRGAIGLSGPYDFYPFDVKQSIRAFGGIPDPAQSQPINLVTPAAPPMLLAQGGRDTTVAPYHSVRLAKKLREAGVRVTELALPALGHPGTVLRLMRPFRGQGPLFAEIETFLAAI